jgi:hypothetical protein
MIATIKFTCGETTCASEPGKFCRFLRTRHYGQDNLCHAFFEPEFGAVQLEDKDGWVLRCPQCLAECGKETR